MTAYQTEFSNFPQEKITLHGFQNADDKIANIINEINALRSQGLYNQASRVIQNNSDILSQYIVDATTFRTWEEEIYNTQLYAKQKQQCLYSEENEPEAEINDIWLGGE